MLIVLVYFVFLTASSIPFATFSFKMLIIIIFLLKLSLITLLLSCYSNVLHALLIPEVNLSPHLVEEVLSCPILALRSLITPNCFLSSLSALKLPQISNAVSP